MMPAWIAKNRGMIALSMGLVLGLVLLQYLSVDYGNPFLRAIAARTPIAYLLLTKSYVLLLFTTPLIVSSAILSLAFVHLGVHEMLVYKPLPTLVPPEERRHLIVVLGELHHPTKQQRACAPRWLALPERGLFTGLACFGAVGSGKTSAVIRPLARQLFAYAAADPARRLGGLILEVKGDLCHQVQEILGDLGRSADYYELSLESRWRYNPLRNPDLDEDATAHAITSLIGNAFGGKSKDPFWPAAAQNLMKFIILLHRLVNDYVTLTDIYQTAIDPRHLEQLIEKGMSRYRVRETAVVTAAVFHGVADRVTPVRFDLDRVTKTYRAEATSMVRETLHRLRVPHEIEVSPAAGSPEDIARAEQFLAVRRWFEHDWTAIDNKLRTSIVEGITVFLSLFDTNPALRTVFCPPKETFNPACNAPDTNGVRPLGDPLPSFAELIEEGRIVALNFPVALNSVIARMIGTLVKLDYQRAVLLRIPKMAAAPEVHWRPTAFICDEYQLFCTAGEGATGDQNFFALSRQPKCIPVVATQSISSLKGALGSDDHYKTLLQTFRTKIFLNTADDVTADYASRLGGKEDRVACSYNISETQQGARTGLMDGMTTGDKTAVSVSKSYNVRTVERFPTRVFHELRNGEAIVFAFDGTEAIPSSYLYLKPWYLPLQQSWWDQQDGRDWAEHAVLR